MVVFSITGLGILLSIILYIASDNELFHVFEAQLPGTTQDHLQIFNIEMKAKMKSHQMPEQVYPIHSHVTDFNQIILLHFLNDNQAHTFTLQ